MYNPGYATGCKRLFSFVRDSKHPSWAESLNTWVVVVPAIGGAVQQDANPRTLLDRSVCANGVFTQSSRDSIVIYSPAASCTLCRAAVPPTTLPNFFPSGIFPANTLLIKGLRVRQGSAEPDNRKFKTIGIPKFFV